MQDREVGKAFGGAKSATKKSFFTKQEIAIPDAAAAIAAADAAKDEALTAAASEVVREVAKQKKKRRLADACGCFEDW